MDIKRDPLQAMAAHIRTDLLEPQGLTAPYLPIWFEHFDGSTAGGTAYRKSTRQPIHITLDRRMIDMEPVYMVNVLAHEMIHSALPYDVDNDANDGHGPTFTRHARAIGLAGDPKATYPGRKFERWFYNDLMPKLREEFPLLMEK